jgi:uncharacterized protein (TIGR02996 family)
MQTEVEAFLKRILRFPDDDAPRLIFADWLEDQLARTESSTGVEWGPERGRFIRIQIALARMKEEEEREIALTGLCKRDNAQNEFEREEQMLLGRHEADWIAPFPGPAAGAIFCRGFVEQLNIGARDLLRYANELFAASPLRHLCLLDMADAPGVFQCQFLSRLAALSVNGSHRGLDLARALANAENLAGLKALYLTGNNFDDDSAHHLAASHIVANLEELDLSKNVLGETSAQFLAASTHFSALRRLELGNNRLGPVGAEVIAGSERLINLQRLGLSHNEIGIARLHRMSRTLGFFRIPVLDLSHNDLGAAGLQVILNRSAGPIDSGANRLRDLNLSGNPLGDDGMRVLAACPHLENLRTLRLVDCRIGDEGVRVLAASPHFTNLVVLDLSNNLIGNTGCRVFLDQNQLRNLKRPIIPSIGLSQKVLSTLHTRYPDQLNQSW